MVLLNTCHIREKAAKRSIPTLGRLKPLKAANPDLKIGVAGCVAQAEGQRSCAGCRWSIWWSGRRPITACPR
jgi:tRNA A37 methylthiotransferase MiaB